MNVLFAAGIESNTFVAQSARAASSSKAKAQRVPTKENLKRGSWSKNYAFEKFCFKEIYPEVNEF